MKTWVRILMYAILIVISNSVLSLRSNYYTNACPNKSPFSPECIQIISWNMRGWFLAIIFVFCVALFVEFKRPIKTDKLLNKAEELFDNFSHQSNLLNKVLEKHTSSEELEVYNKKNKSAKKRFETTILETAADEVSKWNYENVDKLLSLTKK